MVSAFGTMLMQQVIIAKVLMLACILFPVRG